MELQRIDKQIQEATMKAVELQKEITLHQSSLDMRSGEIDSLKEQLKGLSKSVAQLPKTRIESALG